MHSDTHHSKRILSCIGKERISTNTKQIFYIILYLVFSHYEHNLRNNWYFFFKKKIMIIDCVLLFCDWSYVPMASSCQRTDPVSGTK